jgi:hypothetical protein
MLRSSIPGSGARRGVPPSSCRCSPARSPIVIPQPGRRGRGQSRLGRGIGRRRPAATPSLSPGERESERGGEGRVDGEARPTTPPLPLSLSLYTALQGARCWGIRKRVHYNQNHKIDAARQEQFERLTAKSPKPINTLLFFVS